MNFDNILTVRKHESKKLFITINPSVSDYYSNLVQQRNILLLLETNQLFFIGYLLFTHKSQIILDQSQFKWTQTFFEFLREELAISFQAGQPLNVSSYLSGFGSAVTFKGVGSTYILKDVWKAINLNMVEYLKSIYIQTIKTGKKNTKNVPSFLNDKHTFTFTLLTSGIYKLAPKTIAIPYLDERNYEFYKTGKFTDFILNVDSTKFSLHRNIFYLYGGKHMQSLIDSFNDSSPILRLHNYTPTTLRYYIEFIYRGLPAFDDTTNLDLVELYKLADYFEHSMLLDVCRNLLNYHSDLTMIPALQELVRVYSDKDVKSLMTVLN